MQHLKVRCLNVERLGEAYPLIRSATRVSQPRWQTFGRELIDAGGGVLAVISPDGCIHGVAAFRPGPNLRHEQSLDVEVIVAFELQGNNRVREKLCSTLDEVAATHRCQTINFTMAARSYSEPFSRARAGLERLGLKLETVNFVRELQQVQGLPRAGNRSRAPRRLP